MARELKRRQVGNGWTWFEDYVFLWATWTASCPPGRQVQVGMGVSVGGEPRGEKIRFSGVKQFKTIGAGSIHFRVTDGGPPCLVILYSGKQKGVPIIRVGGLDTAGPSVLALSGAAETSRFASVDAAAIETVENFNAAAGELLAAFPDDQNTLADQLDVLQSRSAELENEYRHIRAERQAIRARLGTVVGLNADMGADCDGDSCRTEKKNEAISAGETDTFAHDDQDRGSLTVHCNNGEIEVIVSAAVWSTFDEIDRKRLRAGDTWKRDIPSKSSWYDQTNRVEVVGKADSNYNLDFASWDD